MARVKAGQALSLAKAGTTMEDLASENGLQAQTFEITAMTQYLPQLGQNETSAKQHFPLPNPILSPSVTMRTGLI